METQNKYNRFYVYYIIIIKMLWISLRNYQKKNLFPALFIVLIWFILTVEGHRIIPGAKYLINVIPLWAVIINSLILVIFTIILYIEENLTLPGFIITSIMVSISMIFLRIGYDRFHLISWIAIASVALVLLIFRWKKL